MIHLNTISNLRFRYLLGLSAIALLVTASFVTMQQIVSKQEQLSKLVNIAGHQAGLVNRIAYFASLMATTEDEAEFNEARSQVGRTIHKIKAAHEVLRKGDPKANIPLVANENLVTIYDDPMVGLDLALMRFLERAHQVYDSDMKVLNTESAAYIFLTTYGPHSLEPLLDAAVDEYETISRNAIVKTERLELILWMAALAALLLELVFIFCPLEAQIRKTLDSLKSSITELTNTRKRLLAAQKLALVGDWELDLETDELTWSDQVCEICGLPRETLSSTRKASMKLVHPEDQPMVEQDLNLLGNRGVTSNMEFRILRSDGTERLVYQHAAALEETGGGRKKIIGTIQDITEQKKSEDQIRKLALYDSLTGLANRRLLMDRLAHAIATARRNQNYGAVLMLDLDNFKSLNDTKGHDAGDALLMEVARRLLGCVRETDTVARLGGDEFVVVVEWLGKDEKSGHKKTMELAEKIRSALNRPYILEIEQHMHHTSASIGVTLFNPAETREGDVLKRADVAMYEAKDMGRNRCCFYNEARQVMVNTRSAMAHDMRLGLLNDEFSVYLQPQVLSSGKLCGAEALLRWFPPGKTPVSPGSFIPVAENTGLILPLGEWVLEKTCQYLKGLDGYDLPDGFAIAVNISARQFVDENFVGKVKALFRRTGVDPARMKFELTETSLVQNMERGRRILQELRDLGLRVELDDFGTGYSSLNAIKNLPLTALKLDRSLISGIEKENSSKAIVKAALAMAKAMDLETVGEGVETLAQIDFLVKEGCDLLQGFYYSRPMPYEEFVPYLEQQTLLLSA